VNVSTYDLVRIYLLLEVGPTMWHMNQKQKQKQKVHRSMAAVINDNVFDS
jgi:hypothetical protein